MRKNPRTRDERTFSLELRSRRQLRRASLTPQKDEEVLIEGSLGRLEQVRFVDGVLLEIRGAQGILRLDITEGELRQLTPGGEK